MSCDGVMQTTSLIFWVTPLFEAVAADAVETAELLVEKRALVGTTTSDSVRASSFAISSAFALSVPLREIRFTSY